jgi:hypothetical protein
MASKRSKSKTTKQPKAVSPLKAAQALASRTVRGTLREPIRGTNIALPVVTDFPHILEELRGAADDVAVEAAKLRAAVLARISARTEPRRSEVRLEVSRGFVSLEKQVTALSAFFKRIELLEGYQEILAKS